MNTYTTGRQVNPAVGMNASGNFVVAWQSDLEDGSYFGIFGQRYDSTATPQGAEFQVNTYTTQSQRNPAVAMDSSGDLVVTWDSYAQGSFGRRFINTSGAPDGGQFQVGGGSYPTVATDPAGDFVVTWQQSGDGSGLGVFGKRYRSRCGNALIGLGEGCDDGNASVSDGCDASCQVETCFSCTGEPSTCTPITTCTNGDGCCVPPCNVTNDNDCTAPVPALTPVGWLLLAALLAAATMWSLRRTAARA